VKHFLDSENQNKIVFNIADEYSRFNNCGFNL